MSKQQFKKDCEEAEKYIKSLNSLQNQRTQLANSNQSVNKVNAKIRGELQQLAVEIDHLFRIVDEEKDEQEKDRKFQVVSDLEDQYRAIEQKERTAATSQTEVQMSKQDPESLSNKQMEQYQQQLWKQQDETLEGIQGTVENLGNIGKNMGEEVDLHNRLLDDAEKNVENTTAQINTLEFKIQKILRIAPNNCYIITVAILTFTLIAILIWA